MIHQPAQLTYFLKRLSSLLLTLKKESCCTGSILAKVIKSFSSRVGTFLGSSSYEGNSSW